GGLTLEYDKNFPTQLKLSNELSVELGLELIPQIFSTDYQTLMLTHALESHFEKEKENFFRQNAGFNLPRIKTNSLFFIDSIVSFRGESGKKGWLRIKFEELLKQKIKDEINKEENNRGEYKEFLEASLQNIDGTIAGYFAEDNKRKNDDLIQKEVNDILRDKESMLCFRNSDGSWNLRRFLFSKWTLREGWDNPNVFVIAKLRTSGSEISKIQEVGRGLRLPFDENGSRVTPISNDNDFRLTYIIDYSERDFAKKLIGEINIDSRESIENKIEYETKKDVDLLSKKNSDSKLKEGKIINEEISIQTQNQICRNRIKKSDEISNDNIIIDRKILKLENTEDDKIEKILEKILASEKIFAKPSIQIIDEFIGRKNNSIDIKSHNNYSKETTLGIVSYGEFLKQLSQQTSLPVSILHSKVVKVSKSRNITNDLFNIVTINNIAESFNKNFV
ncbi:MAG: hypothetical protein LBB88_05670, partial [Planctomycetaceae bacterium]|nr:hypothetical protein [Planctomycetaceae bacterium]